MRLLLDEMFTPAIARELRERGHDVVAVKEQVDWHALPDPEVMDVARKERRAVVTNNVRDFRLLHYEAITPGGPGDFGVIFAPGRFRRTASDTGRIVKALDAVLRDHPGEHDLANGEAWL